MTNKWAAAWENINPKLNHEIILGSIYETDDAAAGGEGTQEASFADVVTRVVKAVAKDVVMQDSPNEDTEEKVTKRKLAAENEVTKEAGSMAASQDENASMMNRMLDKLTNKTRKSPR